MKILFTSPIMEYPAAGGPQLRILNAVRALAAVINLDILNRDPNSTSLTHKYFEQIADSYSVLPSDPPLDNDEGIGGRVLRFLDRLRNRLFDLKLRAQAEYLIELIDKRSITVVWFGYGNISFGLMTYIKKARPSIQVVCDTDSVWSRFILRELPYAHWLRRTKIRWKGYRKEKEEKAWVNLCEVTTAVSLVDAKYYKGFAKQDSSVHLFSNVIETETYKYWPIEHKDGTAPSIYLAGTFGHPHSPMDMAAQWVLGEIFPIVQRQYPDAHLYIVGRDSDKSFGHLNGEHITVTGQVDSVLPYLCNASVALVPLKFESGTRFKILEAGACAIPVVSTTLGAEGLPVRHGQHLLIADEAVDFAEAIITLLANKSLAVELAENCKALVFENFSIQSAINEAQVILKYLAKLNTSQM